MDIVARADLPFPRSLPEFQRVFPDDAACAAWLERARWPDGFTCPHCGTAAEACRFAARPGVLRCRSCRRDTRLTAGTVMHRSQTPLSTWFWGAPLVVSQTRGLSATQFQRQPGLSRYETAFGILHKLRCRDGAARPRPDRGARVPCRSRRDLGRRPYARRRPWRPPQDAGGRRRRGPAQEARNCAGQA